MQRASIFFFVFCLVLLSEDTLSQNGRGTVHGKVIDSLSAEPLGFASVRIFDEKERKLIDGNITTESGAFSIAVPNKEMFVVENKFLWIVINGNIQFSFKIIVHPQIVVSHKKMDLDSAIAQFGQFSQNAHKPFWHHGFVFKPKIKKIAEQKNHFGIVFYAFQPFHKNFFAWQTFGLRGRAQMVVAGKVDFFALWDLHIQRY